MRRLLILVLLAVAGCASTGPQLTVAAAPDPASLVGWWRVDGTEQVVLIDPAGLEIQDPELTTGGGLTLTGAWRADPDGRLLATVDTVFGPAFDVAPGSMSDVVADHAPEWVDAAVAFRVDGDQRMLLGADGAEVARLVPHEPVAGSGVVDPGRQPTDAERRGFGPAAPLTDGLRPAEPADLVGRWVPDGPHSAAYFELAEDGTWTGSDGCNGTGGAWLATGGAFLATKSAVSTLMACPDMLDVGSAVGGARRVAFDGTALVLQDADGRTSGPWQRVGGS